MAVPNGTQPMGTQPMRTQPMRTMTYKADETHGDWNGFLVNPPTPAGSDQEILLPPLEDPAERVQKPNPRRHQRGQPPFYEAVTSNDLLSLPISPPPRSDSGRSDLSFRSMNSVYDCGVKNHAAWKFSHPEGPSHPPPVLVEKPVTLESFNKAVRGKLKSFNGSKANEFLPLDALNALINPTNVERLLESEKFSPEEITRTLQGIFGRTCSESRDQQERLSLQRIFTILILMKQPAKAIQKFISNGINDSALPIFLPPSNDPSSTSAFDPYSGSTADVDEGKLHDCFAGLDPNDGDLFLRHQKRILVPFFQFPEEQLDVSFYDLEFDCILPFTEVGKPKNGGCGSVKKIRIHPAHHNIEKEPRDICHAVKTLHIQDDEMFRKEVEAFEKLAHKTKPNSPDHLMNLELVYRHGEECCLIFPWANGNLKEYWESRQRRPDDKKDVLWFFKQCHGIARGLRRLHNPTSYDLANSLKDGPAETEEAVEARFHQGKYGRHGDIKPENILWFDNYEGDSDHLVISDFGLTEFKSFWSKSLVNPKSVPGYSGTYQPPDRRSDDKITQKYDIWSLGCVFLEMASWLLLDKDAPARLAEKRSMHDARFEMDITDDRFFHFVRVRKEGLSPKVKPSVLEWIQDLHALETCPSSVHDFLDMIKDKMLQPTAAKRENSSFIRRELERIYRNCLQDDSYATKGEPRAASKVVVPQTQEEPPQSDDGPQADLYPKLTDEMRRSASVGRQLGPKVKPNDTNGEEAQPMGLSLGEQVLSAEPTPPATRKATITADTTTRSKQPSEPGLDIIEFVPGGSQMVQRYPESISVESLHGADEEGVAHVAAPTVVHDKSVDEQEKESSESLNSNPQGNREPTRDSGRPEIGTAVPVETVSHGTQTHKESWMRKALRRLRCFSK